MPAIWKFGDPIIDTLLRDSFDDESLHMLVYDEGGTGKELARWAYSQAALDRLWVCDKDVFGDAKAEFWKCRPNQSQHPGACVVLFVARNPAKGAILRPAFALPWYWQADIDDDSWLPPALKSLAEDVRRVLRDSSQWDEMKVGLRCGVANVDFTGWTQCDVRSGAAPLMTALLALRHKRAAHPNAWSTGEWTSQGFVRVGDVPDKVRLCVEWGVEVLYLPQANHDEAIVARDCAAADSQLAIESLPEREPDPQKSLQSCLARSRVAPDPVHSALKPTCCDHYEWLLDVDPAQADEYYIRMLPRIIESLLENSEEVWDETSRPTHLVSVVANQPMTVRLAVELVQPRRLLLLRFFTSREPRPGNLAEERMTKAVLDLVVGATHQLDEEPQIVALSYPDRLGEQMGRAFRSFTTGVPAERIAFDLTTGFKLISLLLMAEIAPEGSWLSYFIHENVQEGKGRGRIKALSERLAIWKAGTPFPELCPPPNF